MKRSTLQLVAAGAALIATAACSSSTEQSGASADPLAGAFESTPLAFSTVQSSYSTTADSVGRLPGPDGMGFGPGGPDGPDDHGGHGGPGGHPPGPHDFGLGPLGFGLGGGGLMGGLGPEFFGGLDGPRGPGHGPFADSSALAACTFAAATGRVTCPSTTQDGITVTRSMAFLTTAGVAQATRDSLTTNTINTQITASGTSTHGGVTRTVNNTSNRTVSGLAAGSTSRTVNGTSAGQESGSGTMRDTAFTSLRVAGDTITGVVVPVTTGTPPYPTAGKVIRHMTVTITRAGVTKTSDRREVLTYDGSATAALQITKDGTTTNCTIALPFGRPSCS